MIIYYGAAGHGKGLVGAMSGFGVKGPIRKAVLTEDFHYSHAEETHHYINKLFKGDDKKHYVLLTEKDISEKRKIKLSLVLKDCMKFHMIAFHPNGSVQTKVNMCSCTECFQGDFIDCLLEPGTMISSGQLDDEDSDNNSSDEEHEFEDDDISHDDHEAYELQADCVLDVVQRGSFIDLYSPSTSFELFYICKALDFGTAAEDMVDAYNHHISTGTKYTFNCLEKKSEKKSRIIYKILPKTVRLACSGYGTNGRVR